MSSRSMSRAPSRGWREPKSRSLSPARTPGGSSKGPPSSLSAALRDNEPFEPHQRQSVRVVECPATPRPLSLVTPANGKASVPQRERTTMPAMAGSMDRRSEKAVQKYNDTNIALPAFADDLDVRCSGGLRLCLPSNIIDNRSIWYIAWWWLMVALSLWTAFYIPLYTAFQFSYLTQVGESGDPNAEYRPTLTTVLLMVISSALFVADIFMNFNVAVTRNGLSIVDRHYIASQYLRSSFVPDVIGAVQIGSVIVYATNFAFPVGDHEAENTARTLYLLDLLTLLRLRRIWQVSHAFNLHMKDRRLGTMVIIRDALIVFFWVHWAACIFFLICELDTDTPCGIFVNEFPVDDSSIMGWYLLTFYWSIITYSTVGYGDIPPLGIPGMIFTLFFILGSLTITAYVVGTITSSLSISDSKNMEMRQTKNHLRQFASSHRISRRVETQIEDEIRLTKEVREQGEEAALDRLPLLIRNTAFRFVYFRHLLKCPLFKGCSSSFLNALLSSAHVEVFTRESCILNMFDDVKHLSIVAFGSAVVGYGHISSSAGPDELMHASMIRDNLVDRMSVDDDSLDDQTREVLQRKEAFIPSLAGPGDVFGAISFFTDMPQPETVTVSSSLCHVIMLPREAYMRAAEQYPADSFQAISMLYDQARELYSALSDRDLGEDNVDGYNGIPSWMHSKDGQSQSFDSLPLPRNRESKTGDDVKTPDLKDQVQQSVCQIWIQRSHAWNRLNANLSALILNATARNNWAEMEEILDSRAAGHPDPINLADAYGRTGLMVACRHGHGRLAQTLIKKGADVNAVDKDGSSPLMEAVQQGHASLVKLLRSNGARPHLPPGRAARLICGAISSGSQSELSLLLDAGLDLSDRYHGDGTPLHVAAACGSLAATRMLLEKGHADPRLTDGQGRTPAEVAAAAGHKGLESALKLEHRRLEAQQQQGSGGNGSSGRPPGHTAAPSSTSSAAAAAATTSSRPRIGRLSINT